MTDEDRRARGRELMRQVYGWEIGEVEGRFVELTVDHLFGDIWANGDLSVRERRLVLIGLLVGQGLDDVVALQLECALRLGEIHPDELRELVVLLSHYAGWPTGAKLNSTVEELIGRADADGRRDGDAPGSGA